MNTPLDTGRPDTNPFAADMMARAINLARRAIYSSRPNPAVGCVLERDGAVVGEGFTQPHGHNHAEIEALQDCADPRTSTAYITLEPCSHHGHTGPCADALIAAGVRAVFVAMRDPNPEVTGRGIAKLVAAGVTVHEGLLAAEAETINPGFYKRMRTGLPCVRIKLATSLDGRSAMADGSSQWITGAAARADVQRLRGSSDAIVTGVDTVISDDPALTVRDPDLDIPQQPLRVILDSTLRTPPAAKLFKQPGKTLLVYSDNTAHTAPFNGRAELLRLRGPDRRVNLPDLLTALAARQINDILVECGPRLAGSFLLAGLADELVVYMAPTLLGSKARPLLDLPFDAMAQQQHLQVTALCQVGNDYRWTLIPATTAAATTAAGQE